MYSMSSLQETCYGIYQTFVTSHMVTNAQHAWVSRELLRRMLTYFHLHYVGEMPQDGELTLFFFFQLRFLTLLSPQTLNTTFQTF